MILVQKMPMFYNEKFVHFGYQFMLTLFVQTMGMGLAGYLRRFSVYPVKALWPTILVSVTFLLQRIPDFHIFEYSRMQYLRTRSRTNVTISPPSL